MDRLIMRFRGTAAGFTKSVSAIEGLDGVTIVDRTPRMLLVEATPVAAKQLGSIPEWTVSPETFTPLPDPRERVRGGNA
jgi:hypothetical protein